MTNLFLAYSDLKLSINPEPSELSDSLASEGEGKGVRSAKTAAMSRRQARSRTPCRANLEPMFLVSTGEESPGSLNSKFAWETQVPVRVRTVPQKRRILCEAP